MSDQQPPGSTPEKKISDHFDFRMALLLVVINSLIVYVLNIDGAGGAPRSAGLQIVLTFIVVGLFMPRIRRAAQSTNYFYAYIYGGLVLPAVALAFTYLAHAYFETPNLFGTAIFLIASTFIANVLLVVLKRNYEWVPSERIKTVLQDL